MMPKEFIKYMKMLIDEQNDTLCPAEKLMLLGIDPFSFYRRKKSATVKVDEDEYNDDFDEGAGSVDEEPYEDYNRDGNGYIYDDDEYDLADLKDYPFLRAVLLYNNNRRKYYA